MFNVPTGGVFCGQGAKALYMSGFLLWLEAQGTSFTHVSGVSSGSLLGSYFLAGQTQDFYNLCLKLRNKDVYSVDGFSALTPRASVLSNKPLENLVRRTLNSRAVIENPTPFQINATDYSIPGSKFFHVNELANSDIMNWSQAHESLVSWIMASTAIPGIFPQQGSLVDGGVIDDDPLMAAVEAGCKRILVFTAFVNEPLVTSNLVTGLGNYVTISTDHQLDNILSLLSIFRPEIEVIVVRPQANLNMSIIDFDAYKDSRQDLIAKAYADCERILRPVYDLDAKCTTNGYLQPAGGINQLLTPSLMSAVSNRWLDNGSHWQKYRARFPQALKDKYPRMLAN